MSNEFLQHLKPGDEVIMDVGKYYCNKSLSNIQTVERVTKTQIILENGGKFRKSDGYLIGGNSWNTTLLKECTQAAKNDIICDVYRNNLLFKIRKVIENKKFREETINTYERVAEAMAIDCNEIAEECGYTKENKS